MISRPTWVLLGLFVLVAGMGMYIQWSQDQAEALATDTPGIDLLFQIQGSAIVGLQVKAINGASIEVRRETDGAWTLLGYEENELDSNRIERAVTNASSLRILSTLESRPDLDFIGLNPSRYTIVLTLAGGERMQALIGNLSPIGNGYYVQLESDEVVVVNQFNLDAVLEILEDPPIMPEPDETAEPQENPTVEP